MPTQEAAPPTEATEAAKPTKAPTAVENTTDATRGEPLAMRARTRRAELVKALERLGSDNARAGPISK